MADKPECLCNAEDLAACDWVTTVTVTVGRQGKAPVNTTESMSPNQSVLDALNLALHLAAGATAGTGQAAIAAIEACYGEGEVAVAARKLLTL